MPSVGQLPLVRVDDAGAHAGTERQAARTQQFERVCDAVRDDLDTVTVRLGEYDGEFVTSVAPKNVAVTRRKSQHIADGGQRAITGLMPVVVVDLLQAVEVEHYEGERRLRPERGSQLAVQPLVEVAPDVQAGESVDGGQLVQLCIVDSNRSLVREEREQVEMFARGHCTIQIDDAHCRFANRQGNDRAGFVDQNSLVPELFVDRSHGAWRQDIRCALLIAIPTSTGLHDEVIPVVDERDEGVGLLPVLVRHDGEERVADPKQAGDLKQDPLQEHCHGLDLVQVWGDVEDVLKSFAAARHYLHCRSRLEADVHPQQQLVRPIRLVVVPLNVQS